MDGGPSPPAASLRESLACCDPTLHVNVGPRQLSFANFSRSAGPGDAGGTLQTILAAP